MYTFKVGMLSIETNTSNILIHLPKGAKTMDGNEQESDVVMKIPKNQENWVLAEKLMIENAQYVWDIDDTIPAILKLERDTVKIQLSPLVSFQVSSNSLDVILRTEKGDISHTTYGNNPNGWKEAEELMSRNSVCSSKYAELSSIACNLAETKWQRAEPVESGDDLGLARKDVAAPVEVVADPVGDVTTWKQVLEWARNDRIKQEAKFGNTNG